MANPASLVPFKKGYDERREGNGRKPIPTELIALLNDEIGDEGVREAIRDLQKMSKKNVKALELLLAYVYGKPKETIHVKQEIEIDDVRSNLVKRVEAEQPGTVQAADPGTV